ncbi:hypothetical protein VIGAN_01054000 [Vigna angularis var. angularis]|uniref:Uncharacterized protein n=1 Tax=Vigna angularis var. angularis TaxID=157739 RepID=A0A0S3QXQ8_PHAAN|nr:hypothetical protein VIGAN_01054000 [Vigna angularis var. angularis]
MIDQLAIITFTFFLCTNFTHKTDITKLCLLPHSHTTATGTSLHHTPSTFPPPLPTFQQHRLINRKKIKINNG